MAEQDFRSPPLKNVRTVRVHLTHIGPLPPRIAYDPAEAVEAERDKAQQLLRELMNEVGEHRRNIGFGTTDDQKLYLTAQRIREEMEG